MPAGAGQLIVTFVRVFSVSVFRSGRDGDRCARFVEERGARSRTADDNNKDT